MPVKDFELCNPDMVTVRRQQGAAVYEEKGLLCDRLSLCSPCFAPDHTSCESCRELYVECTSVGPSE